MKTKRRSNRNALGRSQENLIARLLASGRFNTRDEVVRAALRLLHDVEKSQPLASLKPFTKEEARRAFAPDREWDVLESQAVKHARPAQPDLD
jgi:putative addiction module CopG family antidote